MLGAVNEDIGEQAMTDAQAQRAEVQAMVATANDKAVVMTQASQDAMSAMAKIPAAVGGWGIVWLAGVYWFVLRPLLK